MDFDVKGSNYCINEQLIIKQFMYTTKWIFVQSWFYSYKYYFYVVEKILVLIKKNKINK